MLRDDSELPTSSETVEISLAQPDQGQHDSAMPLPGESLAHGRPLAIGSWIDTRHPRQFLIPRALIREFSVVGFTPSNAAAPFEP
jgi:hypothetical protein